MSDKKVPLWRERLASPLTWHYAGFAVLLILAIALSIRLGMDWAAIDTHSTEVLGTKQTQLKALDLETAPLRGLDGRVDRSDADEYVLRQADSGELFLDFKPDRRP